MARLAAADDVLAQEPESTDPDATRRRVDALVDKGEALAELGRPNESLAAFGVVIERYGTDPGLRGPVAAAMHLTARELVKLKRFDEALKMVDALMELLGDVIEPELQYRLAGGLASRGSALTRLGRHAEAEATADELIERFTDHPVQGPDGVDVVAWGLLLKGVGLHVLKRSQEGLALLDDLIDRYDADGTGAEVTLAQAMNAKAGLLTESGRANEALAIADEVVERYGESRETDMRERVSRAVFARANALSKLGRSDDAIAAFDEVIARFGDLAPKRSRAFSALYMKLVCLSDLGRVPETVEACQALLDRFDQQPEDAGVGMVADGLRRTGQLLAKGAQHDQAIAVFDNLIGRCGPTADPQVRRMVNAGMFARAKALWTLKRADEAIAGLEDLYVRFDSDDTDNGPVHASEARLLAAIYLRELGRVQDSIEICDKVIEHLHGNGMVTAQVKLAEAIERKCDAMALEGRVTEMLAAHNALLDQFGSSPEPHLQRWVARALRGKTWCLVRMGRITEAITVTDELLTRLDTETDPAALTELADLLMKCSSSLLARGSGLTSRQGWNVTLLTLAVETARSAARLQATTTPVSPSGDAPRRRDGVGSRGRMRAMIHQQHARAEQALKLATAVITRLGVPEDSRLQAKAIEAQIIQHDALIVLGRWPSMFRTSQNLVARGAPAAAAFERRSEQARREGADVMAAGLLMSRALIIGQQGEPAQAVAAYDRFIDSHHTAQPLRVRALVWLARRLRNKAAKAA